ncbi:MAG: hypothetical protein RLZZ347_211 [Candidatus Parcubacteria bacterium]|jgi:MFS family permease
MDQAHIPKSIKTITLARSIRWFGWGLCETLIPVLLFSLLHNYTEAGLLRSIYDIVFLLALPFVSMLGDRIPAKKLILFALALYPLIGISYFLAGLLGMTFFIVLARAINGVVWCCDSIGGDTYLRRFASEYHLSKTFGYLHSLPNLTWMIAALVSIPFLTRIPIYWLFLGISVTAIIAYFVMSRAPQDEVPIRKNKTSTYFFNPLKIISGMREWKTEIWTLTFLTFFVACVDPLGTFFLPLFVYTKSNDLSHVVIITVIYAIPSTLAFWFGTYIDKVSKWTFVSVSLLVTAVLLGVMSLAQTYLFQIIGIFILGTLTVCLTLALQALVTKASRADNYGKVGGLMAGAEQIGAIVGPITIGLLADIGGTYSTFLTLGTITLVTAVGCFWYKARHTHEIMVISH